MSTCYTKSMNDKTNKYVIIKNDIKNDIENGLLKPDQKISSEKEICEHYNVSRITATRALSDLVSEGYLYRIQGKGTFVKGSEILGNGLNLLGFTKRMKDQNLELKTKLIETSSVLIPKKMAKFFNLDPTMQVILLKRVRIVDGQPLCISMSYLIPEIFYWTTLENMEEESLYDLLEHKYKFKLGKAIQRLKISYLTKENAKYLKITEKDPCLKLSLFSYLEDGRPAQFEETYYLGNKYSYELTLSSPKTEDSF